MDFWTSIGVIKDLNFPCSWGNDVSLMKLIIIFFILLFKFIISGRDVTMNALEVYIN